MIFRCNSCFMTSTEDASETVYLIFYWKAQRINLFVSLRYTCTVYTRARPSRRAQPDFRFTGFSFTVLGRSPIGYYWCIAHLICKICIRYEPKSVKMRVRVRMQWVNLRAIIIIYIKLQMWCQSIGFISMLFSQPDYIIKAIILSEASS